MVAIWWVEAISLLFLCGHKLVTMKLTEIIGEMQHTIDSLQERLNELRLYDKTPDNLHNLDMLLTRQEAARFLCKSERQLDRLCEKKVIRRETVDGHIRIRKSELIRYQGFDIDCRQERLEGQAL